MRIGEAQKHTDPPDLDGDPDPQHWLYENTLFSLLCRCLRNIQVLLDAAVMEMQQYSAVVAR
jgi:hypothetical protein